MIKKMKLLGIVAVIVLTSICGVFLNAYLSNNSLLMYSTGNGEKAFLKATWKMSPREIERANNVSLSKPDIDVGNLFAPEVTNRGRYTSLTHKDVFLWGYIAEVEYDFFDNMLYQYHVSLTAYDLEKPHKEIIESLRTQFGEGKDSDKKRADIIYSHDWETEKQTISYWMGKNEGKENYFVGISAKYKPFYKQIEEIAKTEKKGYF